MIGKRGMLRFRSKVGSTLLLSSWWLSEKRCSGMKQNSARQTMTVLVILSAVVKSLIDCQVIIGSVEQFIIFKTNTCSFGQSKNFTRTQLS